MGWHSARIRNPREFNPKTFREKKGGVIYGKKRVPKTVHVVWGKIKGRDKPRDMPIPQALQFNAKHWTAAEAKKWLKKNRIKYMRFIAALKGNPCPPRAEEENASVFDFLPFGL